MHSHLSDDPLRWSPARKWTCTIIIALMTATIAFCSSIHTAAVEDIEAYFHESRVRATLGVTTFLLGFGFGPLLFAPLSEIYGRNNIYRISLLIFVLFNIGCALAPSLNALLALRFLAGFFGSPAVTNSGGSISDIWPSSQRSVPFALFTAGSFLGPVIAPIVGGFVSQYTTWRWNYWIVSILSGVVYIATWLLLPETYQPYIARKKDASADSHVSSKELVAKLKVSLTRPVVMLFAEPIVFSLSLYMALVYGILYLDFSAYPMVFQSRGWSQGIAGLAFIGIGVGMAIATALSPLINRVHDAYTKKLGGPLPEARLPHLIIIAWLIPIGLFWFAWTADQAWILPILAGVPFGLGLVPLFLGITSYLVDCYGKFSASALAANAVFRSVLGAVFPLFGPAMFEKLGVDWGTSLLGFLSVALAPLPWIFYKYGASIRARSVFHTKLVREQEQEAKESASEPEQAAEEV